MVNPYLLLTEYEGADWKAFLDKIGLLHIFGELLGNFNQPSSTRQIMRYILWTYSINSDRIVEGQDWETNKKNNYTHAGLPANLWTEIGLLKDQWVTRAIHNWLEYQDEPLWKQILSLKDLKMEMQLSYVSPIKKPSTEIDYDQKYKNAIYAVDLDKLIQQLENQLLQNNPKLREAVKETRFTRKTTTGVEAFSR